MKKKLIIFPFNGNGLEALDCINHDEYEFLGFVDDDVSKKSDNYEIFKRDIIKKHQEIFLLAVPGSSLSFQERIAIIEALNIDKYRFITAIHPNASIGRNVQIGYNCLIMAGVVITSNAQLHNHICILPNSVVHHDVIIDSYTLVGSNVLLAGGVSIGRNCYIGSGSNIISGIHIDDCALVGLGSNVLKNVAQYSKVAGNPAKLIGNLETAQPINNS